MFSLVVGLIAVLANLSGVSNSEEINASSPTAWGNESLTTIRNGLQEISPIALANACGLGASSCFKCHNGQRAAAPNMDETKSPWHAQHKKANNSCVGCHKGNPRIMVKEMSHNGLVKSAREGTEICGNCHKPDFAKIESAYKTAK
jgi:nitrate/TMAO reductase-like tetraheme cytochrome c subunit